MVILAGQLINLPGYEIIRTEGRYTLFVYVRQRKRPCCIHCACHSIVVRETKTRKIRHENISQRKVFLIVEAHKFECKNCGRVFWERLSGVLPYGRKTELFRKQVAIQAMHGVTRKQVSISYEVGEASVYRYFVEQLKLKAKEYQYDVPIVLGIDEHFFTKKKGYATTFCDLKNHRVYDVVLGRTEKALEGYLMRLKGKEKVRVVCIDLCSAYRSLIKKHFPNAKIVSDRFHVVRLINAAFLETWKMIDPVGRKNRGLYSLIVRHPHRLTPEQEIRLGNYFDQHPQIKPIYEFKQEIMQLVLEKKRTARYCKKMIPRFLSVIHELKRSKIGPLVTLGNTMDSWKEEIVRMWRFTKNNGITEGFHNKMEMISRRAFGFRNFENYRLWVKILCH